MTATTYGTGELIRAALDRGCAHIIVGVGGSATVDGGAGAMQALGARLLDAAGNDMPPGGGSLALLDRIDLTGRDPRLAHTVVRVASDVTNTLCGPRARPSCSARRRAHRRARCALSTRRFAISPRSSGAIAASTCSRSVAVAPRAASRRGSPPCAARRSSRASTSSPKRPASKRRSPPRTSSSPAKAASTRRPPTARPRAASPRSRASTANACAVIAGSVDPTYAPSAAEFDVVESMLQPGMTIEDAMRDAFSLLAAAAERIARQL